MKKIFCMITAVILSASIAAMPVSAAKNKKDEKSTDTAVTTEVTKKTEKETTKASDKDKKEDKKDKDGDTTAKDKNKEKSDKEAEKQRKKAEKEAAKKKKEAEKKKADKNKEKTAYSRYTVCFDTDMTITEGLVQPFTAKTAERTGLKLSVDKNIFKTNASIAVSQDFAGDLEPGEGDAGFFMKAETFGLETFSGYEISLYVYAENVGADRLRFFTDGDIINYTNDIALTNNPTWQKVTIKVPEDINNNIFGVMITSSKGYTGTVCRIDDITITDPTGKNIANIGDYKAAKDAAVATVFTVFLFVMLIVVVAGALWVFIHKMRNRYR